MDFRNPTSLEFTDERVKQLFKIIDIFGVNLEYSNLNFHLPILFWNFYNICKLKISIKDYLENRKNQGSPTNDTDDINVSWT